MFYCEFCKIVKSTFQNSSGECFLFQCNFLNPFLKFLPSITFFHISKTLHSPYRSKEKSILFNTKITAENGMECNHESKNKDRTFFQEFLLIHKWSLDPQTVKDVCLPFPSIIQFLQFLATCCFLQKLGKHLILD